MVTAVLSQGCELFGLDDSVSPCVIRKITQPQGVDGIGGQADTTDGTSLDSTAKEKIPGLLDNGTPSFDLIYNPQDAGHVWMENLAQNPTIKNMKQWYFGCSDGLGFGQVPTFTGLISAATQVLVSPMTASPKKYVRTGYLFTGFVKSFARGAKVGDKVMVKTSIDISGAIFTGVYNKAATR
jgi:hypothetical protein